MLYTLGYNTFGLPAKQFAIQTGTHPHVATETNTSNMERQLSRLGLGHDRRRTFTTTGCDCYK